MSTCDNKSEISIAKSFVTKEGISERLKEGNSSSLQRGIWQHISNSNNSWRTWGAPWTYELWVLLLTFNCFHKIPFLPLKRFNKKMFSTHLKYSDATKIVVMIYVLICLLSFFSWQKTFTSQAVKRAGRNTRHTTELWKNNVWKETITSYQLEQETMHWPSSFQKGIE